MADWIKEIYCGFRAPITPATTGPIFIPVKRVDVAKGYLEEFKNNDLIKRKSISTTNLFLF